MKIIESDFDKLYEELSKLYEEDQLMEKDGFKKAAVAAGLLAAGAGAGVGINTAIQHAKTHETPISAPAQINNDADDYLSYNDEQVDRTIKLDGYVLVGRSLINGKKARMRMKVTNDKVILASNDVFMSEKTLKNFSGIVLPGSGYICRNFGSKSASADGKVFVLNNPSKEFFRELQWVPDTATSDLTLYCDGDSFANKIAIAAYNNENIYDDWADNLNISASISPIKVHYQVQEVTMNSYPKETISNKETTLDGGYIGFTKTSTTIKASSFYKLHHFQAGTKQDPETKEVYWNYINIEEQKLTKIKLMTAGKANGTHYYGDAWWYEFTGSKLDGNTIKLSNSSSFLQWLDNQVTRANVKDFELELWFEL